MTRTDPPLRADEAATLRGYLDFHRDTLRLKTDGLSREQLGATHAPSPMTLGGMVKHLALVEDHWFGVILHGEEQAELWRDIDWDGDPDWEWRTGSTDDPAELRALFDDACATADSRIERALANGGLDHESVGESRRGEGHFSLRWIIVHMIEEYARHNGHADLIRESIDGETGE